MLGQRFDPRTNRRSSPSLTVTPGTIQPAFSSNTTLYTVDAPTGAATVTVIATPKDSTTLVTIDGTIATQRSISLGSPGSIKIIPIVLESQNGLTSTYTVTVTRLLSGDNNLSALSVKVNNATSPDSRLWMRRPWATQ